VSKSKIYQIGKELVEAANAAEATAIKKAMVKDGKVTPGAVIVEAGPAPKAPKAAAIVGSAVGMPEVDASPMSALRGLGEAWQENVVTPVANAVKSRLTPEVQVGSDTYQTASPVSDMIIETAADPVNYVPGGAGAVIGGAETLASFAEGGEVDFISDEEMEKLSPTPKASTAIQDTPQAVQATNIPDFISEDEFESDEDKYGGLGQQAVTFLEGAAQGVAGPLATLAEKHVLGVADEDQLMRRKVNPITHGAGQTAGIVGSVVSGTGAGSLMAKAGQAAEAATLARVAQPLLRHKVGSAAVREATEMAIFSSGDEVSKMILNDPNTTAEDALANIGLGTALGGVGGAAMGVVSPLWSATGGKVVDDMLGKVRGHLDGSVRPELPDALRIAQEQLGVEFDPILKAAASGDRSAAEMLNTLRYGQNEEVKMAFEKLSNDVSESVMRSLGVPLDEAQVYSKAESGQKLFELFKKEYETRMGPIEEAFNKRNAEAAKIFVPDDARLERYGDLLEKAMLDVGTDSPQYKLYSEWGNRLLAKDTVGGLDQLKTELGNDLQQALRAADYNKANALRSIRNELIEFQEEQILKQSDLATQGMFGSTGAGTIGDDVARLAEKQAGKELGASLLNERAEANRMYREFAKLSEELLDHVGGGNFKGAKTLLQKLESVGPEALVNKFSVKNNAELISFLSQHFPETMAQVQKNELKDLIRPAITSAKGEMPVNVKKLSDILKKTMAGRKELAEFALSPEALAKIDAAEMVLNAIPQIKDSGTAGGLAKLMNKMPQSAMAAVSMVLGNNPITGYLVGELAQRLGRNAPDAARLAYLKFLGSEQPVKAQGFKAMFDYIDAAAKGEMAVTKATKAVFKAGAQVVSANAWPSQKDNDRLDRQITKLQNNPTSLAEKAMRGDIGYYMPEHQTAGAGSVTKAAEYLKSLKPQPHKLGPLDKEVPPTQAEKERYNRALTIANNPNVVLDYIKSGRLLTTDMKDLNGMYPALYRQMAAKLSNELITADARQELIPYETRMAASLFLGQALDASMQPLSIMAAQPKPQGTQQQPQQGGGSKRRGSPSALKKTASMYKTQVQDSESDRATRD